MNINNKLFDLIIIGADPRGINIVKKIIEQKSDFSVLFLEEAYSYYHVKNYNKLLNFKLLDIQYNNGLITIFGKSNEKDVKLFCTKLLFSDSLKIKTFTINSKKDSAKTYYTLESIPKVTKQDQLVIFGNTVSALNAIQKLYKKVKYIYYFGNLAKIEAPDKIKTFISTLKNVVIIENQYPIDFIYNWKQTPIGFKLAENDFIHYSYILSLENPTETQYKNLKLLTYTPDQKIEVNNKGQTLKVPTIFAIGANTSQKVKEDLIVNQILNKGEK